MKERLTGRQITMLIIMFIIGTSSLTVTGIGAGKDVWLAIIIAIAAGLLVGAMYVRLMTILPGKDFFYVLEFFLGKIFGRIALVPLVFFAFNILYLMVTHFGMFVTVVSLTATPLFVIYFPMILICAVAVKNGIEVLGRWNQFALIGVLFFLLVCFLFSMQKLEFQNLRPVLYEGIGPVLIGSLSIMAIPICELFVFMLALPAFKKGVSGYKVFLSGISIGGLVILLIALMDISVLGADYGKKFPFLTYETISLIKIGEFLTRLEIVGAIIFTLAIFLKISVAFIGVCKGIANIFDLEDYRVMVMPMALLTGVTAVFSLTNINGFIKAMPVFFISALPFELVLPFILFMFIEIKYRVLKKKNMLSVQ